VVGADDARLGARLLLGEQRGHGGPVVELLERELLGPGREPGRVAEDVPDEHAALAGGGELGPVRRHGGVQVDRSAVGQQQDAQRGHGLGRGPHGGDGVSLPRDGAGRVGVAAPEVDHRLAVDVDGRGGAGAVLVQ